MVIGFSLLRMNKLINFDNAYICFDRLASTPAMFNSTLTEKDDILCPVDGSIMITGQF